MEKSYISTLVDEYIEKANEVCKEFKSQIVEEKDGKNYVTTFGSLLIIFISLSYFKSLFRR